MKKFDLLVIGGGSGGIACSKRAASYGKKVAVFESKRLGGTCVNVGCVPKKVMFNTAEMSSNLALARKYGFSFNTPKFDYNVLKGKRDALIERLNGIYMRSLEKIGVQVVPHYASFVSDKVVEANGEQYTAPNVVIAAGGEPDKLNILGKELAIDSDDFFNSTERLPKKCAIIGGGYIAVELAGVLKQLGSAVTIVFRKDRVLSRFDDMLRDSLTDELTGSGVNLASGRNAVKIEKHGELLNLALDDQSSIEGLDMVLMAVGRQPVSMNKSLKLSNTNVKLLKGRFIRTDEWDMTSVKDTYAIGDINGKVLLTPVAIAAGRRLCDRIFGNVEGRKMDYTDIPSVVFSHPPIGTIGLTESQAREKYGSDNIKIYTSSFVNLYYTVETNKPKTKYKLVCLLPSEKVVGMHLIGMASDEILQGFGVAIKMGATKKDFDSCVAIHPTAAEELVTMT